MAPNKNISKSSREKEINFTPAAGRIIDASLNRCAEALRVTEDICRFYWNFQGFARELKELRHAVLGLFIPDPSHRDALVKFRDIEGDVGKETASPISRPENGQNEDEHLKRTAIRNLERAREALRTLEEVTRETHASISTTVESLRYHLYSIEKGLCSLAIDEKKGPNSSHLDSCHLYLLATRALCRGPFLEVVAGAMEGGVDILQMREKNLSDREILELGRQIRQLTLRTRIPLVINDRPDLARVLAADGVHLGQDDMPLSEARGILDDNQFVGISTHSVEEARKAIREGADYIGIGPVFPTSTKEAGPCIGPKGFEEIFQEAEIPAFAIGGIDPQSIQVLASSGAKKVAISSAILHANSGEEARKIASEITRVLKTVASNTVRHK